jgi:hypothetical protein
LAGYLLRGFGSWRVQNGDGPPFQFSVRVATRCCETWIGEKDRANRFARITRINPSSAPGGTSPGAFPTMPTGGAVAGFAFHRGDSTVDTPVLRNGSTLQWVPNAPRPE